jgi:AraC-like DNA-binding protein
MYVQEGMITVETEDATINIGRHQYIWLDACVHHKLTLPPGMPSSVVNIEFAFQPAASVIPSVRQLYQKDETYAEMLNQPAPWLMLNDSQDMMGSLLQQVVLLANSTHRKNTLLCSCLTQQCLMIMAAQRLANRASSLNRFPGDPLMERAALKVDELCVQPLTVDQLAAGCGTTVAHLQQLFQRCTGLTVHEYMQRVRIEKSKPLLQNGCTVLEAAARVGFSGQQYYTQLFKRMNGVTPAAYRLRYQKRKLKNE